MSAARHAYGHDSSAGSDASRARSNVIPLLLLVAGLVAASVWFVALPAFDQQPAAKPHAQVPADR